MDIYTCSWGPDDSGSTLSGPEQLASRALRNGALTGRGGLGSLYVWAAGNGGNNDDDCNADGFVNSIYTIAVNSVDQNGNFPSFAERCSSIIVCRAN